MAVVPSELGTIAQSQNIQALIDNSQDALTAQSVWRRFLRLGIPGTSLTFTGVIGRSRIEAAASIVDPNSKKPVRSRNKAEVYTGNIPAIMEKIPMTQEDFRKMMTLEGLNIDDATKKQALMDLLWNDVQKAAVAPDRRIDIMLMQILSTLGVDVNATNNPDGVAYGTVDMLAQPWQKQGVPVAWTDTVNADPFADIDNFLIANRLNRGRSYDRMLIPGELWILMKKNAKVQAALSTFWTGKATGKVAVTDQSVNDYLMENKLPIMEVVNYSASVEKDGVPQIIRPFDANAVSFIKDGIIGTLENALAVEERFPTEGVQYARFGRTLISKWGETDPKMEYTGCELNAFPAVDIDNVAVLTTNVLQASFV